MRRRETTLCGDLDSGFTCSLRAGHKGPHIDRGPGETSLPEITDIQRITPQPGDVLVARCEARDLGADEVERVKEALLSAFPDGVKVLIADKSWRFWVASKVDEPSAGRRGAV